MRRLIPALLLPAVCLSMHAESTGRIVGKVVTKEGKPIAGAKILLNRTDVHWSKELTSDSNGRFIQVGLEPRFYDITITAEGYVQKVDSNQKVPLGDALTKDYVLLTPQEAQTEALQGQPQSLPKDPAAAADVMGREAFNKAIPAYNDQKYSDALPEVEKAYKNLTEAMNTYKDDKAKEDLKPELVTVSRVYGICLALGSPDRKAEAEPFLTKSLESNPKDERVLAGLIEISKAKGDKAAEAKYQGVLDSLHGPDPNVIYNKAVSAFNGGNLTEAKNQLQKVLQIDAKYPEAFYLMAMVNFGENNLRGTKQNLEKYLELAPSGKNAAMAREMLKDPSLKKIK